MTRHAILGPRVGGVGRVGAVIERRRRGSRQSMRDPAQCPLRRRWAMLALAAIALSACASQSATAVAPQAPGFWWGLLHGFIFPFAWVGSLFSDRIAIYAVPNSGGWYDFGYFLGIVVFGVGSKRSHTVYRDRVVYRDRSS